MMELVPLPVLLPPQVGDVVDGDGDRLSEGVALHLPEVEHGCQQDLWAAQTVAALYVDPKGVYANLPGVEVWDEARDARLYAGPWPVVAHPPCARWSLLGLCRGYYDGQDDGCFEAALNAVRAFGGVLEHPRHSLAWKVFGLPRPSREGWTGSLFDPGLTCEVDQRWYGHDARKPTWLYYVGDNPPALRWGTAPRGSVTVGRGWGGGREHERAATPVAFRDVLLGMCPQGLTG